jgi:hypothetical protein
MVRWPVWGLGLLLFAAANPSPRHDRGSPQLPGRDRARLAEAFRLADTLCDSLWPGWGRAAMPVLLVTDEAEFLVGHPAPSADFARAGYDSALRREVWTRPPRFPPTLLATFPAVGGQPTIVVGPAERTGKSSADWVLTLLHEHFHQWQYTRPGYYEGAAGLGLARGDTTGRWMLEYPFPYDSAPVQQAMRRLAVALVGALDDPPGARAEARGAVVRARDALRDRLSAADYRYFEFQLWQEGVARFIEYAAALAAAGAGSPAAAFRGLPDHEPYAAVAERGRRDLRRELERLDLGRQRRVSFYPVGAAMALLLDATRPDWRRHYARRPFALAALL